MARSGAIEIPVAVDAGGVEKSIRNGLIDPIEDAEDALKKLGKTDAGKDIDKQMDRAQDATEDLSKELDDARDDLKKLGFAAKDAGDDARRGMDKAKDGAKDFKDEANSTARETAASFDGSAESIGDAFQEVAANAFGAFGPAAGLAGLAVAAGIGGIKTTFDELAEKSKEVREGIIADFLEVGDALDQEAVDARVRDLLGNENTRKQVELLKEILGVDLGQAALIAAGDFESAGVTMEEAFQGVQNASGNVDFQTWLELKNTMESTNEAFEVGNALAKAREDAAKRTGETERDQIQRTKDAAQARYEEMAAQYANPIEAKVRMTVDTSQAYRDLQAFQNRAAQGVRVPVGLGRTWE